VTSHPKKLCRNRHGFTLVETLIAMVILSITVLTVGNAWSGNIFRVQKSRINSTTAILLQRKMTEMEITYQDRPTEVKEEEKGDFGAMYPGYSWEMKSKDFEMPDMSNLLISRDGGADEMLLTMVRTVSDYIKHAAKEVQVSVIYKPVKSRVKTQLKNSVTSYFIDYTKDIAIPGVPGLPGGAAGAGGGGAGGAAAAGGGSNPPPPRH